MQDTHANLILAGDVGGTKTLLLIAENIDGVPRAVHEARYENIQFESLEAVLSDFLGTGYRPAASCFAIAGPIEGREARLTNLPWKIDADALGQRFGFIQAKLINDFVAVGYGIEALGSSDLVTLQEGKIQAHAPRVVLGAGTGLGECLLVWGDGHYEVVASEGGHVDFAPTDALQIDLLRQLQAQFGHVSYERVLSGSGLSAIYELLRVNEHSATGLNDPAEISQAALLGDPLATRALEMFIGIYGAQAGNLALTCLARGGVYVAGGIAPQIIDKIRAGGFMRAFLDKGRHARLMDVMPVHVVMNPKVGLLGAALAACRV
jgi:glucokinase